MRKLFYLCLIGILLLSGNVGLAGFNPYELDIEQSATEGTAPLTVNFYGVVIILIPPQDGFINVASSKNNAGTVNSTTPGGNNYVFTWTFGDGTGAKGASVSHVYSNPGRYTITCTCNVGSGIILSKTTTVNVYARIYTVTYNGNGNTSGTVPIDSNLYGSGQTVTVLGNTGNLSKTGYSFAGWSLSADGSGQTYTPGQTFIMGTASVTLYAKWVLPYNVTYDGNGYNSGTVPVDPNQYFQGQPVTVLGNTGNLTKFCYAFAGWSRYPDGSGLTYIPGQTFPMEGAPITLYAKWTLNLTVTYDGNGNTSGSAPVDPNNYLPGQNVTVLGNTGNLYKWGSTFAGWSLALNGSGTCYTPGQTFVMDPWPVTLFAKWKPSATRYQEVTNLDIWPDQSSGAQVVDMQISPLNGRLLVLFLGPYNNPNLTGIYQYSLNGASLGRLVPYGTGNGQLPGASGLTVDQYGNIYAGDQNGFIHKFDANGNFIRKWSGYAGSMAIDKNNNLLYALAFDKVWVYDLNGNLIRQWPCIGFTYQLAVNNDGNIYLVTLNNGREGVYIYNTYGTFIKMFGIPGSGNGEFSGLEDIAIDPDGFSYTTEYNTNRIQKFDPYHYFICKKDLPALTGYAPVNICEYQGKLYVAVLNFNFLLYRIKVYAPY